MATTSLSGALPNDDLFLVVHPGIVKDREKAVQTLGGYDKARASKGVASCASVRRRRCTRL